MTGFGGFYGIGSFGEVVSEEHANPTIAPYLYVL